MIEEDLFPLATLRNILRHVRLLRLANQVLRPTQPAANEVETVRRLRSLQTARPPIGTRSVAPGSTDLV